MTVVLTSGGVVLAIAALLCTAMLVKGPTLAERVFALDAG